MTSVSYVRICVVSTAAQNLTKRSFSFALTREKEGKVCTTCIAAANGHGALILGAL